MEAKMYLRDFWNLLQCLLSIVGLWQFIRWLLLLTTFGKRFFFRREVYDLAHANIHLFWGHHNDSLTAYLSGSSAVEEGSIISDWYNSAFITPLSLFSQRSPEELVCIINFSHHAIKKVKEPSKQVQYQQMAPRFNAFYEKLENISKKFPGLCPGLSRIELLPLV